MSGRRQVSKGKHRRRSWGKRVTPVWEIAVRLGLPARASSSNQRQETR